MVRLIMMWMLTVSTAKAQWAHSNMLSGAAALGGEEKGFWAGMAYPAAMGEIQSSAGIFVEKRFLTDLAYYDLGYIGHIGGQPFQVRLLRDGNTNFSSTNASVSLGRKISEELGIAVKLGYTLAHAKGYGSVGKPLAGLGAVFKLSSRLWWGLQADGVNGFLSSSSGEIFLVRMGLGYQVSDLALISLEMVKEKGYPVHTIAGMGYKFGEYLHGRIGYAFQLATFNFALGFRYANMDLELTSIYHLSLGPSAGLSISYHFKQAE